MRPIATLVPAGLLAAWGIHGVMTLGQKELPVLKTVPPFSLAERSGRQVRLDDLRGKVWIADFIFTSCGGTCPGMTAQMRRVQEALGGSRREVVLVSFTVDPERDSEAVLSAYAEKNGADSGWLFLRGEREEMARLSREGFWLGGLPPGADRTALEKGSEPIPHDRHFALVDRQGRIRGYYDGSDPDSLAPLVRDARALLEKP